MKEPEEVEQVVQFGDRRKARKMYEPGTVREWLFGLHACSETLMDDLAREESINPASNYWTRVQNFIQTVGSFQYKTLSMAERAWLQKIRDGLIREADK